MVYSPGNRDYHSAYQPSTSGRVDAESRLPRSLFIAVVVLGLATYGASFGPVADGVGATGWFVRFAALAALCAGFGMLANQSPPSLVIAVLAAMGLLDALSSVRSAGDPGWALILILVLNALQAIAALAALLLGPKAATGTAAAGYEAYVDYYNQAVRNYYNQQTQATSPERSQRAGYGQAHADAQATQRVQRAQRPSQQGDYADLEYSDPRTAQDHDSDGSAAAGPIGIPSIGHASAQADRPHRESEQSTWPSSPS
ncbi:DUF5336 domain-containing protein [Mycobacterium sp. MMS18-G62]